jgi:hypothetical protein
VRTPTSRSEGQTVNAWPSWSGWVGDVEHEVVGENEGAWRAARADGRPPGLLDLVGRFFGMSGGGERIERGRGGERRQSGIAGPGQLLP